MLAALCPFTANYVASPLTETLSIFCVALGFRAFAEVLGAPRRMDRCAHLFLELCRSASSRWRFAGGGAMDGPPYLRPQFVGIQLALSAWPSSPGSFRCSRLSAWTLRNGHTFHVFQPLAPRYANDPGEFASPGFVRWVRTLAADFTATSEIYWNGNSDRIDPANLPTRAIDNPAQHQETERLLQDYNAITTLTPEIDARFDQLAQERIQLHPFRYYLTLPLLRLADMWLRPRVETMDVHLRWWEYAQHPAETRIAVFYGALNLAYLVAAVLGPSAGLGWQVRWSR